MLTKMANTDMRVTFEDAKDLKLDFLEKEVLRHLKRISESHVRGEKTEKEKRLEEDYPGVPERERGIRGEYCAPTAVVVRFQEIPLSREVRVKEYNVMYVGSRTNAVHVRKLSQRLADLLYGKCWAGDDLDSFLKNYSEA